MPLLTHSSLPDPSPFCFSLSPLHSISFFPSPPPSFPLKQSNCLQHSSESPTLSDADQAPASQSLFSTTTVNTSCGSRSRRNLLLTLVCVGASAPLCGCVVLCVSVYMRGHFRDHSAEVWLLRFGSWESYLCMTVCACVTHTISDRH